METQTQLPRFNTHIMGVATDILYISISKINRTINESYIIYVELYTSLESVKEFGKFGSSEEF